MTNLDLGPNMVDCPKCWENFIDYINMKPGYDVPLRRIQRELKKYNAQYRSAGSNPYDYIEFKSEKDLSFFILRWS